MPSVTAYPADSAAARGIACCHVCLKATPVALHRCPRCHAKLHLRLPDSLQRTVALLITAAILYIPANVLPIMTTDQLGQSVDSTILGGVVVLVEHGSYPVAAVIFIASVLVPIGKMLTLAWLCLSIARRHESSHRQRTFLYRVTEFIGRWSMVDVFVVTILVALIHFGGIMQIRAGPAAVAFAGVVVMTMLAAESFDPRLMWDQRGDGDD
jgi:paraquat-inducible protein A